VSVVVEQPTEPGFTVVDRRRRADEEPAPPRRPAAEPPPPRTSSVAPPEGPPQADLASLCIMFYSQALVHLGHAPDPLTGQVHRDLEQARFFIDLLAVLREKTEGNRTHEESGLLDELLPALQIGFVRASRSA
jgi:hypothetical protein